MLKIDGTGIVLGRRKITILLWLVPIVITLIVAWYPIRRGEREAAEAELERARRIRTDVGGIVEEHVINGKPIDSSRIIRLIEVRRKEAFVKIPISVKEIYNQAEFNILKSRYLDFRQKEKYKTVFNLLYKELATDQPTE